MRRAEIHSHFSAVRQVEHIILPGLSQRDGIPLHGLEGLHPLKGQSDEESIQESQLRGGAFARDGEGTVVGSIDPVPDVAVADRAIEAGRETAIINFWERLF
jgi:hypothetical protein